MSERFVRSQFENLIGTTFQVSGDQTAETSLVLGACEAISSPMPDADQTENSFTLLFRGQGALSLPQSTYRFKHDELEPFRPVHSACRTR